MNQRRRDGHRTTEWTIYLLIGLVLAAASVVAGIRALAAGAALLCLISGAVFFLAGILYARRLVELNKPARFRWFRDADAE